MTNEPKVTRLPAEDPDEVRRRDKADIDADLGHLGGSRRDGVFGDEGTTDEGAAQNRRTRT